MAYKPKNIHNSKRPIVRVGEAPVGEHILKLIKECVEVYCEQESYITRETIIGYLQKRDIRLHMGQYFEYTAKAVKLGYCSRRPYTVEKIVPVDGDRLNGVTTKTVVVIGYYPTPIPLSQVPAIHFFWEELGTGKTKSFGQLYAAHNTKRMYTKKDDFKVICDHLVAADQLTYSILTEKYSMELPFDTEIRNELFKKVKSWFFRQLSFEGNVPCKTLYDVYKIEVAGISYKTFKQVLHMFMQKGLIHIDPFSEFVTLMPDEPNTATLESTLIEQAIQAEEE